MSAAPKPETGTAVAPVKDPDEGIGKLPPEMQQQIALRRMMNKVAAQIAGMTWGQNISPATAHALAEWGRRYNVDVTQEVDILGNRVYLNSKYYLRRLGELIASGLVEYAYADHIHEDARLTPLGEQGKREADRRAFERIRYNAPDKAAAVVAFHVRMKGLSEDVVGVNWAGGGVRKSDPVGDNEPVKTAESRAARRCLRQLVSHVPLLAEETETVVATLPDLEARIQHDQQSVKQPSLLSNRPVSTDGYDAAPRRRRVPQGGTPEPEIIAPKGPPRNPIQGRDEYELGDADERALDQQLAEEGG